MKRIILFALVLCSLVAPALAHGGKHPAKHKKAVACDCCAKKKSSAKKTASVRKVGRMVRK